MKAEHTHESMELLGMQIDTLENLQGALKLPMPANLHVQGIRGSLPDVVAALKRVYIAETGDNPWATGESHG
ncbi:hypothetical protein [Methylibium sp.]|uniref:hypothetical protein n=1 Tax=Methylibium sp. TaxID=2067992 RepID=UPI003D124EFB